MRRAFTFLQFLILVAVVLVGSALVFPLFARARYVDPKIVCMSNLRQIAIGFQQYTQDYGKFPPVHIKPTEGWANSTFAYTKSEELFQCDKGLLGPAGSFTSDYVYNRRLDRLAISNIKRPETTILLADGDDNAPTWNSWTGLPADALTNFSLPVRRHRRGAFYCFADGHVKWMGPEKISSSQSPTRSSATFAVR